MAKKPRGQMVNGRYRPFRPTERERRLNYEGQAPDDMRRCEHCHYAAPFHHPGCRLHPDNKHAT